MFSTKAYAIKVDKMSSVMKTNLRAPLDETMFWIEYACKFPGVPHLRSYAEEMSWFKILSIDVILTLLFPFVAVIVLVIFTHDRCCIGNNNDNNFYDPADGRDVFEQYEAYILQTHYMYIYNNYFFHQYPQV